MSITIKGGGALRLLGSPQISDYPNADVRYSSTTELISGTADGSVTVGDAIFESNTLSTYFDKGNIVVDGLINPTFQNLTPAVATIGVDGVVERHQSGICKVICRSGNIGVPITLDLQTKGGDVSVDDYVSPAVGSMVETLISEVETRITNGMTMATNGVIYTTKNHATQTYVRNPNLWCADVADGLTAFSPWNSRGANTRAGTLVTPRHALGVPHYPLMVGDTIRYVAADNTVFSRTIIGKARDPNYHPYHPEFEIYTLSSDLPASIKPCKVMPADWSNYLVNNQHTRPPMLCLDQEGKVLTLDLDRSVNHWFLNPLTAPRTIFMEDKIGGDSGQPAALIVAGEIILITVLLYGFQGAGTPIAKHIPAINAMILAADTQAGVSTGYTVTPADFSAYPNFTNQNYLIGDDGAGNKSLWVESGLLQGRMSYILNDATAPKLLAWDQTGTRVWTVTILAITPPISEGDADDISFDDVATPDLATFSTYTFTTP